MGVGVNHGVEGKYPSYPALASGERLTTKIKLSIKLKTFFAWYWGREGGGRLNVFIEFRASPVYKKKT